MPLKFWGLNSNVKINRWKWREDQTSDDVLIHKHHSTNINNQLLQNCKCVPVMIFDTTSPKFRIDSSTLQLVQRNF